MTLAVLRRISLALAFVLASVASADLVCAWPCASEESPSGITAGSGAGVHHCHQPSNGLEGPAVSGIQNTCGMEHGGTSGPAAERRASRLDVLPGVMLTQAAPVPYIAPSSSVHDSFPLAGPGAGPPSSYSPLRI